MDLFHGDETEPVGEWKNWEEEKPKHSNCKLLLQAKNASGGEMLIYALYNDDNPIDREFGKRFELYECNTHNPIVGNFKWKHVKVPDVI